MCRNVLLRTIPILAVSVMAFGLSALADDGPPLLTPPAGAAPIAPAPIPAPASTKPAAAAASLERDDHSVLALPGITVPARPRSTQTITAPLPPPSLAPSSDGGLPPLEMPGTRASRSSANTPELIPLPSDRFRGKPIESVPADSGLPALEAPSVPPSARSGGAYRPRTSSNQPALAPSRHRSLMTEADDLDLKPRSFKDKDLNDDDLDLDQEKAKEKDKLKDKPLPPRPRMNLFSRFSPRPPGSEGETLIKTEPRPDPAADAAIKRRIEKAARETVGDRARAIEVKVVGRSITIQATGVNFFQKRTVRRSLETMPGLSGYRSTVEVY